MSKEITISKEKFMDITATIAVQQYGLKSLLFADFVAKIAVELFDKEEKTKETENTTQQPLEELKEGFKPHLKNYFKGKNVFLGLIGEPTPLTALNDEPLYVGDVVEIYMIKDEATILANVCKYKEDYFIMGIMIDTLNNLKNGTKEEYIVKKVKSYKDLIHNEKYHNDVTVILKENENE